MKTYVFPVRIERDESGDGTPVFSAACDALNVYTFGEPICSIRIGSASIFAGPRVG